MKILFVRITETASNGINYDHFKCDIVRLKESGEDVARKLAEKHFDDADLKPLFDGFYSPKFDASVKVSYFNTISSTEYKFLTESGICLRMKDPYHGLALAFYNPEEMDYSRFLFNKLLCIYSTQIAELEYDLQFGASNVLYEIFEKSPYNKDAESEYDCMVKFMENQLFEELKKVTP